jgi:hypothetical protein
MIWAEETLPSYSLVICEVSALSNQANVVEPQEKIKQVIFRNEPGKEKGIMGWLLVHGMF